MKKIVNIESKSNQLDRDEALSRLKQIIPLQIPIDKFVTALSGEVTIDIIKLDKTLSRNDPDYNGSICRYKGNPCSMSEYVLQKYGTEAVALIKILV